MTLWLMLQTPPKVDTLFPTSIIGLLGSLTGLIGFSVIMYEKISGKGRKLEAIDSSIKRLTTNVEAMELKVNRIDTLTTEIDHEVRGVGGENGIKATVKDLRREISLIHELTRKNELLRERFKEIMRQWEGPERRQGMQGLKDLLRDAETE